jgi:ankyrin repeat protein
LLVESGADVNGKDSSGDTAIKIAKRNGFGRIVELLERSGARVDEPVNKTESPTTPAAKTGPV